MHQSKPDPSKKLKAMVNRSVTHTSLLGEVSVCSGSWECSLQKLAMFSCSLYFITPSVAAAWAFVIYSTLVGIWNYQGQNIRQTAAATLMVIYLTFCFFDKSPTTGSRSPILRGLRSWWRHSCDYLPLLLVKTADLPADGNYVLGYHPHGIISVGCFNGFATDGARTLDLSNVRSGGEGGKGGDDADDAEGDDDDDREFVPIEPRGRGFSSLFPGLDRRVITLPQNFQTPFVREYFLGMGACTSSKETFRNILGRPSTAVIVVVGGAAESMHARAGSLELVLETRRGFVREAILAKASLVPVIAFGENDLYRFFEIDDGTWIGRLQGFVKKHFGFAMPIFTGRSLFLLDFGVMPQRKPVNVVVGAPIKPPKLDDYKAFDPKVDRKTDEAINEDGEILKKHHAKYVEALEELYDKYKSAPWNQPGQGRQESMRIIKK